MTTTDRKIFFVYCYFEMNVLLWCPFVHLFDTLFEKASAHYVMRYNLASVIVDGI